jgi:hypothetical protein
MAAHRERACIAEAANAVQAAEIMIEGAILLHHEHDVLDVGQRTRLVVGGNGERFGDARRK